VDFAFLHVSSNVLSVTQPCRSPSSNYLLKPNAPATPVQDLQVCNWRHWRRSV